MKDRNDYNERCRGQGRELVELEVGCGVRDFAQQIQTDLKNNFVFWNRVATLLCGKIQLSFSDERGFGHFCKRCKICNTGL